MRDVPDITRQLSHAAQARGGGLLFSGDLEPVLGFETFMGERAERRSSISPNLKTKKVGKRVQTWADSAEAVRMLKRAHGVPLRPTDEPVDLWAGEVIHG